MAEREKVCILCGNREVMPGYICWACQERIQQEEMHRWKQMRKEAKAAVQQLGLAPGEEPE